LDCPNIRPDEYDRRSRELYHQAGVDWVIVYGDREHAANIAFLSGFDPRFEEALLILGPDELRVLVVGNEGLGYASQAAIPLRVVLCQSFSLMGQPRSVAPRLDRVLHELGIGANARVGVVGWKYLEPAESDEPTNPAFVPAFLVEALRRLVAPNGAVTDVTTLLMHPAYGLKSQNSAAQIAAFEWAAARASEAVLRIVRGARPGMTELEAAGLMGYAGEPLSCHVMMVSDAGPIVGLRSPTTRRLAEGDGVTTAIGYWGGLSCRAGLLRDSPDPDFLELIVKPYYRALVTWYETVQVGVEGRAIYDNISSVLTSAIFDSALNPGHLISLDEWTHTPIRDGSTDKISAGMTLQCDIIPAPLPVGKALNCEDTFAIADAGLRAELRANYPELWIRIEARRDFMRTALGIAVTDDVLPLSTAPAYLPPFWMASDLVCSVIRE